MQLPGSVTQQVCTGTRRQTVRGTQQVLVSTTFRGTQRIFVTILVSQTCRQVVYGTLRVRHSVIMVQVV